MKQARTSLGRHRVTGFFLIAFAFWWSIWLPMALAGVSVYQGHSWPTHAVGLFGPLVAAFAMTWVTTGRPGLVHLLRRMLRWKVQARWYVAAFAPIAFFAVGALTGGFTGRGWPDLAQLGVFSGLPLAAVTVMWLRLLSGTRTSILYRGLPHQPV